MLHAEHLRDVNKTKSPQNPHSMIKQHQLTWTPGKMLQSRWLDKGQVWWQCVPEQLGNAPSSPCQTRSWWCWHPLAWNSGHHFLSPGCSLHGGPRGGHGFYLAALMAALIHPRWGWKRANRNAYFSKGCDVLNLWQRPLDSPEYNAQNLSTPSRSLILLLCMHKCTHSLSLTCQKQKDCWK